MSAGPVSAGSASGGSGQPFTVLVNLLWLVPGVVGGSEESVTDALRAVVASAPEDLRLHLAVLQGFADAHPDLAAALPTEVAPLDGADKARRVLAEQTWLAARTRAVAADVVHHAGGTVPLVHPASAVVTIHDLQPLDLPHNFSWTKRTYLHSMLGRSARAAEVVCVPSEFTARRVVELLHVDAAKVHVVPWAARTPEAASDTAPAAAAGVPDGPFLLYPAITYPHKNHLVLLEAFARLDGPAAEASLVLTGGPGPDEQRVQERIRSLGLDRRVLRPGRVDTPTLEALYRSASAVVVPSRYEGFGLPALEAMVRDRPVLASRAGSLPEVARAEDLVDPDDVTAWAEAMQAVLTMSDRTRAARVDAGRDRVARFRPERTAAALVAAYRTALRR